MSFYVEKDKHRPVDIMKQKKKRKSYQNYEKKKKPERKNHIVWLEQKKNSIQKLSQKWCLLFTISS